MKMSKKQLAILKSYARGVLVSCSYDTVNLFTLPKADWTPFIKVSKNLSNGNELFVVQDFKRPAT